MTEEQYDPTEEESLDSSADPAAPGASPAAAVSEGDPSDSPESYQVHLDRFDGPLDLLLYLIGRDEIDVYDIPIAHITKQYLQFLELLDVFDLDNAGEFLVMAATLMRIKARMLLPVQRLGDEEDDDIDPRDELVRRLLEYKKYKEASQSLAAKEEARADYFRRGSEFPFLGEVEEEAPELSLSLFDLLRAVRSVLEEMRAGSVHHVYTEVYTVEGQEELLLRRLHDAKQLRFEELFRGMSVKMEVVVTFVALLDLLKNQRVRARQSSSYGDIWIEAREPEAVASIDAEADAEADSDSDSDGADAPARALRAAESSPNAEPGSGDPDAS